MYHMFLQKSHKPLTVDRSFNDIICNDTIESDGRKNGEPCSSNKTFVDTTANSSHWPTMLVGRCPLIPSSFVNENKHVWIQHFCGNVIHVDCTPLFISLRSWRGNNLPGNTKTLKCSKKIWKCGKFMTLGPKFTLKFIKVDGIVMLNNGGDESNVGWAEESTAPNRVRVSARVGDGAIFWVQRERPVNEWFLDA